MKSRGRTGGDTASKRETLWGDPSRVREFRRVLLAWYRKHGRSLPWRDTSDPYRIWISEIMLQQTTVAAVIPYYQRFFERFPTLHHLAEAPEQELLRLWEGLGYYSRARNLHRAAKLLVGHCGGEFPTTAESLQELPGIGRYTAGAIASFAFDLPAPIVEANTQRLYARLLALRGDPRTTQNQSTLWGFAAGLHSPRAGGGTLNQSLMELGARICTPADPKCNDCPVRQFCEADRLKLVDRIPELAPRKEMTDVHECALLIHRRGKWLLRQIPTGERWAGLWDFPRLKLGELSRKSPPALIGLDIPGRLNSEYGVQAEFVDQLRRMKHTVTRFRIQLDLALLEHRGGTPNASLAAKWYAPSELHELPLPVTGRKIVALLDEESHREGRLF